MDTDKYRRPYLRTRENCLQLTGDVKCFKDFLFYHSFLVCSITQNTLNEFNLAVRELPPTCYSGPRAAMSTTASWLLYSFRGPERQLEAPSVAQNSWPT